MLLPPRQLVVLLALTVAAARAWPPSRQGPDRTTRWRADIDSAVAAILAKHPDPFTRTTREAFEQDARTLRDSVASMDDDRVVVRLMQLVASVGDGHTRLEPGRLGGFHQWFPVRFYRFTDGLFITAIDRQRPELLGARVERIGRLPTDSAAALALTVHGVDNALGAAEGTFYLSSAPVMRVLGIAGPGDSLELGLRLADGTSRLVRIGADSGRASIAWAQWGEMFGPAFPDSAALTTPFGGIAPLAYRTERADRPLHLRHRGRWRYWLLPEQDMAYFQLNFMLDSDAAPFEPFVRRMFRAIDSSKVRRLVIDLRYNGGGDGTMSRVVVHELIKRDTSINQPGRLFVLVGRKTFSAGIVLLDGLLDHTAATLIGEPAGAPLNHFGDPTTSTLPYSGMALNVSTRYWQFSTSDDRSTLVGIHVPAPFSSGEWFGGEDPALAAIAGGDAMPIPQAVATLGGNAARNRYARLQQVSGGASWWQPWDHRTMRRMGDSLLAVGRPQDAMAAYELNARHYPCEWRSWDSYGEGSLALADSGAARTAFARALEREPDNWNNRRQREVLRLLDGIRARAIESVAGCPRS